MNGVMVCNVICLDKSYLYDKVLRSSEEHSDFNIDNNSVCMCVCMCVHTRACVCVVDGFECTVLHELMFLT